MPTKLNHAALLIALGWVCVFIAALIFRPLMPVDETRYLSVAWEMLVQNHWILPTLNFEPYSHKPPLLFWLIRMSWEIFGIGLIGPRIVVFTLVGTLFYLTHRFANMLFGREHKIGEPAALTLATLPLFLIYGGMVMFDSMLAVFVIGAQMAIWQASKNGHLKSFLVLGLLIGMGALAKGPVTLLYMLPAALLAPVWVQVKPIKWRYWYGKLLLSVLIGAAIGFAWAIPAAIQGGAAYAEKIFVTQSAGRMLKAFDHVEPFWFYVPVLAGFLLPILLWPRLWRGAGVAAWKADARLKFLLCWVVPVFVLFSAISSKQIHYMIPILPGFCILAAFLLTSVRTQKLSPLPILGMLVPSIVVMVFEILHKPFFNVALSESSEYIGLAHIVLAAVIYFWVRKGDEQRQHYALCLSAFLMVVFVHIQLGARFLPRFDLTPVATALQTYQDRPIAAAPKYDGEYGFVTRATAPITSIGREDITEWLAQNPNGLVIGRFDTDKLPTTFKILDQQDFRMTETILLLEKK